MFDAKIYQRLQESHNFDAAYKGPYVITKVMKKDRYIVED